ncbi:MAG: hypothetical protein AB8B55_03585 [Mariniblastus sp.]
MKTPNDVGPRIRFEVRPSQSLICPTVKRPVYAGLCLKRISESVSVQFEAEQTEQTEQAGSVQLPEMNCEQQIFWLESINATATSEEHLLNLHR